LLISAYEKPDINFAKICRNIVITDRAFSQMYNETCDKGNYETSGLLLGHWDNGVWYVIESTDPGYKGKFSFAYHENDQDYSNHVANVISRIYKYPLRFIGVWHRHPGSFDSFSSQDDVTNSQYSAYASNKGIQGCLSMLVNIDPIFRITAYHVGMCENKISYKKIEPKIGDINIKIKDAVKIASKEDIDARYGKS